MMWIIILFHIDAKIVIFIYSMKDLKFKHLVCITNIMLLCDKCLVLARGKFKTRVS